jgi:hypothetical protein
MMEAKKGSENLEISWKLTAVLTQYIVREDFFANTVAVVNLDLIFEMCVVEYRQGLLCTVDSG